MATRDPATRYHPVTRLLHWGMALAIAVQFIVGYGIDRADDLVEWIVEPWVDDGDEALVAVHLTLGLLILALAIIRVWWRSIAGLPPWAPQLTSFERRLAHDVERVLYAAMFLIPLSGIALVLFSGEDGEFGGSEWRSPVEVVDDDVLLGVHIAAHLGFFVAMMLHVGLVAVHQWIRRDGLLRRMW